MVGDMVGERVVLGVEEGVKIYDVLSVIVSVWE